MCTARVRQRVEQRARLARRTRARSVAGAVEPPDLALRALARRARAAWRARRGADPGADQRAPALSPPAEDEGAPRRRDRRAVAGAQPRVEVAARGAVRLALDADPVLLGAGRAGQRVAAQDGAVPGVGPQRAGSGTGRAAPPARGAPSGSARRIETTVSLSRSMAVTRSGRKPGQAGGGRGRRCRPALPPPGRVARAARGTTPASRGSAPGCAAPAASCPRGCPGR